MTVRAHKNMAAGRSRGRLAVTAAVIACLGAAVAGAAFVGPHIIRTGGLGAAGIGPEAAAAVQGAVTHGKVREENEDFAWEIMRKECLRGRGTTCEAVLTPSSGSAGRARSQSIVQFARVLPAAGADASQSPQTGSFSARNLLTDGGPSAAGWRSSSGALPAEVTLEMRETYLIDRVAFRLTQTSPPPNWAREIELLVDERSIGRWTLRQNTTPQTFSYRPMRGRVVRVLVHSIQGDGAYAALGGFALGVANGDPGILLVP